MQGAGGNSRYRNSFRYTLCDLCLLRVLCAFSIVKRSLFRKVLITFSTSFDNLFRMLIIALPIRYFSSNTSRVEIDFVLQTEQEVIPVEVKAEQNVYSKSLITLLGKRPDLHALRFSLLPYSKQQQIENVPLYAVSAFFEQYKK